MQIKPFGQIIRFLLKISFIMKTCFLTVLGCCFEYLKTVGFGLNQIEAKMQKL
jgi:hypothetical protein